jgi:hypothetical protein
MAYDFLGLVNDVNKRLNEVELTSSNFAAAAGFYGHAKDAVNAALQDIDQQQFEWPFNFTSQNVTLTAGTTRYALPSNCKSPDMESFRIQFNSTLNVATTKLQKITYDDYLKRFVDQEYNTSTGIRTVPLYVFRAPNLYFGVSPLPDQAYTLTYEYYKANTDLSLYSDVPVVPEAYRHVIIDGAMYYAYLFRGNTQDAVVMKEKFKEGVKSMRTILINQYDYITSTMIETAPRVSYVYRIA